MKKFAKFLYTLAWSSGLFAVGMFGLLTTLLITTAVIDWDTEVLANIGYATRFSAVCGLFFGFWYTVDSDGGRADWRDG